MLASYAFTLNEERIRFVETAIMLDETTRWDLKTNEKCIPEFAPNTAVRNIILDIKMKIMRLGQKLTCDFAPCTY